MTSRLLLVAFAATALTLGSGAAFAGIIMPSQPVLHSPPSDAVARGVIDPNYKPGDARGILDPNIKPGGARGLVDPNFKPVDARAIIDPNFRPGDARGLIDPNVGPRG